MGDGLLIKKIQLRACTRVPCTVDHQEKYGRYDDMFFLKIILSKLSTESTMQANLASPLDGKSQEVAIGFE